MISNDHKGEVMGNKGIRDGFRMYSLISYREVKKGEAEDPRPLTVTHVL